MASTFLTLPTPFLHKTTAAASFSNRRLPLLKNNSLKVNAISKTWEPTKVVPQADRVLIRLDELKDKTAGGILLPKSAVKFERYLVGEVLNVGAEAGDSVKAGSKVLFTDVNAYEVDLGTDAKHCFCKSSDLLAVVE
ncbi:10 kDa chaperonin 1, chloroplastic-like [Cicer arietinum]|uniref:10 kDa chaperonin 1, chloroplastic-like n=1 Tax=Cicer arietinum TaxID=3827 RepID=A0A1S2YUG3_CICAR|nr:10 kDa chaperonin 1, chloroplastic-like [Cicer arietinum]